MCIFSSDIVVKSTKIMAGKLENNRRLLAYQNSVVSKTDNVMMLPIPCDDEGVVFLDTRPYASFLEDIALKIAMKESEGMRGGINNPKGFDRVGQYRYKLVPADTLQWELEELNQPVHLWLDEMLDEYEGWSWLLCIIDAGAEMKNQPLMIEYTSIIDQLYFPMKDVHGDDQVRDKVQRDHVLIIGHKNNNNLLASAREFPEFPYPELNFVGQTFNGYMKNGDVLMSEAWNLTTEKMDWQAKWA